MNALQKIDEIFFILINHDAQAVFWDHLMVAVRNPSTWIPLYIIVVISFIKKAGSRAWIFILFSLLTFVITDNTSSQFKILFERLRPCADPAMSKYVREVIDCGGLYSFPSNHATNHFGLATFWFLTIADTYRKRWYWVWPWCLLICYAQVYVGKHFPLDVTAGALLGFLIGAIMAALFRYCWTAGLRKYSLPDFIRALSPRAF